MYSIHSTTRSPIIAINEITYPIKSKREINSYFNDGIKIYIYNINEMDYDEVFLFLELNKPNDYTQLIDIFQNTSVKRLNIVHCS